GSQLSSVRARMRPGASTAWTGSTCTVLLSAQLFCVPRDQFRAQIAMELIDPLEDAAHWSSTVTLSMEVGRCRLCSPVKAKESLHVAAPLAETCRVGLPVLAVAGPGRWPARSQAPAW